MRIDILLLFPPPSVIPAEAGIHKKCGFDTSIPMNQDSPEIDKERLPRPAKGGGLAMTGLGICVPSTVLTSGGARTDFVRMTVSGMAL
jgi:hypothetical protein